MSLDALADDLERTLDEAAEIVREVREAGDEPTRKQDGSALTAADLRVDAFLRERLPELRPAAWLSEETADDPRRLESEWAWIVDPVDGTKEFVRGLPEFAVSVGLVRQGEPVLGGVVNPATGELGVGAVGVGARFRPPAEGREAPGSLSEARASVSRTEIEDGSASPVLDLVGAWQPVGSVAYKLLRVAAGTDDLTFSVQPKSEWDVCGGAALLAAAGMTYRRLDGRPLAFNRPDSRIRSGAVAGPPGLVEEFLAATGHRYSTPAKSP